MSGPMCWVKQILTPRHARRMAILQELFMKNEPDQRRGKLAGYHSDCGQSWVSTDQSLDRWGVGFWMVGCYLPRSRGFEPARLTNHSIGGNICATLMLSRFISLTKLSPHIGFVVQIPSRSHGPVSSMALNASTNARKLSQQSPRPPTHNVPCST
ncbi:hypothetical protein RRG08_055382 [Elysia crispata]|nr:hypothetical protein RRG08_055382 [Elysia crispata]